MRVFYRRIKCVGKERIPNSDKLTILVANHQNGMMDPFICCAFAPRQLHWLTRADIFRSTVARKLLMHLNMLPVYRERDKVDDLHDRNAKVFSICYERMAQGSIICMFPEGNHNHVKHLRPLKKGIARVAFGAWESTGKSREVQVIPTGLEYSAFNKFRSNLLLNFGEPISLTPFIEDYEKNPAIGMNRFIVEVRNRLKDQMINIPTGDLYDFTEASRYIGTNIFLKKLEHKPGLYTEFLAYQAYTRFLSLSDKEDDEFASTRKSFMAVHRQIEKLKIPTEYLEEAVSNARSAVPYQIAMALLFLPALLGIVVNGITGYLIHEFVKNKIKDVHFKSSIMFFAGIFTLPIMWVVLYLILGLVTQNWWLSLIAIPAGLISGWISLIFHDFHLKAKTARWVRKGRSGKDALAESYLGIRQKVIAAITFQLNN
ncbi:MAG: 1-acyl-sn-glycerol-3-phosphate acyltransferase [Flavobacteriales bacterium]|nr:1-acyl-sn-glycerol-3-phosphate acyltransferase [Flavobacteriales bacterium]